MKFRFCGDSDCPDWILYEINVLSRLSSVKVKILAQIVVQGILNPPVDMAKVEKMFVDTKLETNAGIKGCMACLMFILTSTIRFNCDNNALHSELQQLGLPSEHGSSIKRVIEEHGDEIKAKLKSSSLKINPLQQVEVKADKANKCAVMDLVVDGENKSVLMTPFTLNVLLENLKSVKQTMTDIENAKF